MSGASHSYGANRRLGCLFALSLCVLAGCVDHTTEGKTSVYTYSLGIVIAALLGGMVLVYLGFSPQPKDPPFRGYFKILVGLGLMGVAVPVLRTDRVEVDNEHFTSTSGLPWNRLHHEVQFRALREIRIEVEEYVRRFERRKTYTLRCQFKSGKVERVEVSMVMRDAVGQILGIAEQRRIRLVGLELLPKDMRPP